VLWERWGIGVSCLGARRGRLLVVFVLGKRGCLDDALV